MANNVYSSLGGDGEIKWKVGLVGESGVGKSCLLLRFCDNDFFDDNDKYTIGVDFKLKPLTVKGTAVKLQIHDTAGQERFRTVTASFYRGANGILLVFDMTQKDSFEKISDWLQEVRNYTPENTPIMLVANKSDLADRRTVSEDAARDFAQKNKLTYFETSAKTGSNVNETFQSLAEQIGTIKLNKAATNGGGGGAGGTNSNQKSTVQPTDGSTGKQMKKNKGGCLI